jgi:hypothetical protein
MEEITSDRRATFFGFAPSSPGRASVQDDRLIVASLPVAERRSQHVATFIQDDSKRRSSPLKPAENKLIKLCRARQWDAAFARCMSHPHEAVPQARDKSTTNMDIDSPVRRERFNHQHERGGYLDIGDSAQSATTIYDVTALGLVCAATWTDTDKMATFVQALLNLCPEQVQCSQRMRGHTPLRDAVRNPSCTPRVLLLLMEADQRLEGKLCNKAAHIHDRDSFEPLDHLILGIHATNSPHSLELLELFMNTVCNNREHGNQCNCPIPVSPLIRLLSLGTSFGLNQIRDNNMSKESPRLVRLLDCARCLIQSNDKLLHTRSRSTQCTALHVALRNYGDYFPIIHLLLESDGENFMIKQRNLYGDLPLHVACSVGVPMNILRLVLQKTVHAVEKHGDLPHSLVWSTNIAGFTAVDLEWMRHIEGGRGFHETRSFYPLETSGIRWHCSRQDEFYRDLLRDAVDQVIKSDRAGTETMSNRERAEEPFGFLLDRIMLLIQVAHHGYVLHPVENLSRFLLHAASSLARASGPCLPKPLLDLIYWMDPAAVTTIDFQGRLPIHYSVMPSTPCEDVALKSTRKDQIEAKGYIDWVTFLINEDPRTCTVADKQLRLPLHYALDGCFSGADAWGRIRTDGEAPEMETPSWQQQVIDHLVAAFPDSADRKDPQSCLFPFMQAASNSNVSLDAVFTLLKRSPTLLQDHSRDDNMMEEDE